VSGYGDSPCEFCGRMVHDLDMPDHVCDVRDLQLVIIKLREQVTPETERGDKP
jgi:hypothetical protein